VPVGERQPYTYNGELIRALRPGFHSSVDYTAAIIDNIEEHRGDGKPFFAYLALQAPHDPFQLPADWRDRYDGRYDAGYEAVRADRIERMKTLGILAPDATVFPRLPNIPAWDDLPEEQRQESARRMELYAAMVEHMDANIGDLLGYLKTTGLHDDTLIFFMSDNGPEGNLMQMGPPWDNSRIEDWGKQGTFIQYGPAWAQVSAGPLRFFKGFVTEGGIRVPLIVAGKGVEGSARVEDGFAHVMDIPATILDVAGVAHPGAEGTEDRAPAGQVARPRAGRPRRGGARPARLDRLATLRQPRDPDGQVEDGLALRALRDRGVAAVRPRRRSGRNPRPRVRKTGDPRPAPPALGRIRLDQQRHLPRHLAPLRPDGVTWREVPFSRFRSNPCPRQSETAP
jgi:arylsulfatase A-like enzyme